ncbi:citrate lyase holo-[acyl-carrier protein] synthase [Anaerosinus massiliensis]|uniref:citrate lyase holo-[acyl-carrier protein] synthase n=1 Tax=Massilibacillus massiliensis TaxID=1806837 RepID=UPI000DA62887|nr:citrate lyase holo-[acyl-carrier protein] synthase [Massilibacillus massiliensis]
MSHAFFEGITVTLEEVLKNKEARADLQRELLVQYRNPIISFTINMPGEVKLNNAARLLYKAGLTRIESACMQAGAAICTIRRAERFTGLEAFFSVSCDAALLKKLACKIEDQDQVGRLLDIDVLDVDGIPISRSALGLPKRKCLLCEQDAVICTRMRQHTVEQLLQQIEKVVSKMQT